MTLIQQHPEWVFAAGCGLLIFSVVTVVLLRVFTTNSVGKYLTVLG